MCRGPECGDRRDSRTVYDAFRQALVAGGMESSCELGWQSCFGRCTQGPNALVREVIAAAPPPRFALAALPGPRGSTALYNHLDAVKVAEVVAEHVGRGVVMRRYVEPPTAAIAASGGDPPTGDRR